jgi:hypothetical protein
MLTTLRRIKSDVNPFLHEIEKEKVKSIQEYKNTAEQTCLLDGFRLSRFGLSKSHAFIASRLS